MQKSDAWPYFIFTKIFFFFFFHLRNIFRKNLMFGYFNFWSALASDIWRLGAHGSTDPAFPLVSMYDFLLFNVHVFRVNLCSVVIIFLWIKVTPFLVLCCTLILQSGKLLRAYGLAQCIWQVPVRWRYIWVFAIYVGSQEKWTYGCMQRGASFSNHFVYKVNLSWHQSLNEVSFLTGYLRKLVCTYIL